MSITAWAEYAWTRLRRMDYWNPAHIPTNAPAKLYRWNAPGLRNGRPEAHLKKLDDKVGTNNFSVRYFHRDQMRRDTGYYPDTPLTLNHALMKPPHSQGLRPAPETPSSACCLWLSYHAATHSQIHACARIRRLTTRRSR